MGTVTVRVGDSVGTDVRVAGTVGVVDSNGVMVALGRTVFVRVGTSVAVSVGVLVKVGT